MRECHSALNEAPVGAGRDGYVADGQRLHRVHRVTELLHDRSPARVAAKSGIRFGRRSARAAAWSGAAPVSFLRIEPPVLPDLECRAARAGRPGAVARHGACAPAQHRRHADHGCGRRSSTSRRPSCRSVAVSTSSHAIQHRRTCSASGFCTPRTRRSRSSSSSSASWPRREWRQNLQSSPTARARPNSLPTSISSIDRTTLESA